MLDDYRHQNKTFFWGYTRHDKPVSQQIAIPK